MTVTYYDFRNNTPEPRDTRHRLLGGALPLGVRELRQPGELERGDAGHAGAFNIRKAPYARGYFLGDYMGLDSAGTDFVSVFGQAFAQNDASQYVSRLNAAPWNNGESPAGARLQEVPLRGFEPRFPP